MKNCFYILSRSGTAEARRKYHSPFRDLSDETGEMEKVVGLALASSSYNYLCICLQISNTELQHGKVKDMSEMIQKRCR